MSANEGPPIFPKPLTPSRKYRCSACDAVFRSEDDLRKHVKIAHPEETEPKSAQQLRIKHLKYIQREKSKSRRKK